MAEIDPDDVVALVDALQGVSLGIADTATSGLSFSPPDSVLGSVGAGIGAGFALISIGIAGAKFKSERQRLKTEEPPPNALIRSPAGRSKATKQFLLDRINKDFAGATASATGSAISVVSQVNTLGAIKNASSFGSTGAHISKLTAMRKSLPRNSRSRAMLKIVIEAKRIKMGARGGALTADLIPSGIPAAGAVVGTAAGIATKIMNLKGEAKWLLAAKILHADAYYSLKSGNVNHPACRIARELLTQRGVSALGKKLGIPGFGAKRAKSAVYMQEPGGWMVLLDKISAL